MKTIELHRTITDSNDKDAERLRQDLSAKGVFLINVMSAAGSGKTTLLMRLIKDLKDKADIYVLEADIASDVDAVAVEEAGAHSIQAHTDGMCHMDAGMTADALRKLLAGSGTEAQTDVQTETKTAGSNGPERLSKLVFLENVGNLICPAEYDTGAHLDLMILSVPEGDDKPLKYPLMFENSDVLVITKTDALPYFDFSMEKAFERARRLNPDLEIYPVSAKTGDGMAQLEESILAKLVPAGKAGL